MRKTLLTLPCLLLAGAASANGFRAPTTARVPGNSFRGSIETGPRLHATGVKLDARWTSPITLQTGTSLRVVKLETAFNPAPNATQTQKAEDDQRRNALPLLQDVADKTITFDAAFDGRQDSEKTADAILGGETRNTTSLGRRTNFVQKKVSAVGNTVRRGIAGKALGLTALFTLLNQTLFAAQTSNFGFSERVTLIAGTLALGIASALVYAGLILPWSSRRTEARLRAMPGVTKVEKEGNYMTGQWGFRVDFKDEAAFMAANLPHKLSGWYLEQYAGGKYMAGLLK